MISHVSKKATGSMLKWKAYSSQGESPSVFLPFYDFEGSLFLLGVGEEVLSFSDLAGVNTKRSVRRTDNLILC